MYYKLINIGSADFDLEHKRMSTEFYSDNQKIVLVDPRVDLLAKVPEDPNITKCPFAIVNQHEMHNHSDCTKLSFGNYWLYTVPFYYVSDKKLNEKNFPEWGRGCSCLFTPHPTLMNYGILPSEFEKTFVLAMTLTTFFALYKVESVGYLIVDTEGYDAFILEELFNLMKNNEVIVQKIKFEWNILTNNEKMEEVLKAFRFINYDIAAKEGHDVILKRRIK